jgi:hypothetical protein
MNSMFGFPPDRSSARIKYHPLYVELVPNSGERLVVGIVANDGKQWHVAPANRWSNVAAALGRTTTLLTEIIDEVIRFYRDELTSRKDVTDLKPPFSTISVGEQRLTAGHTVEEALQNALRLATVFHIPLELRALALKNEELATAFSLTYDSKKGGVRLLRAVQSETIRRNPKLRSYFGHAFSAADKRIQASIGFLSPSMAADFVSIRPKQVRASTRDARTAMHMLSLSRKELQLKKDAPQIIYMKRPSLSEYSDDVADTGLVEEACFELSREALRLEIIPKIEEGVPQIVDDIISLAMA